MGVTVVFDILIVAVIAIAVGATAFGYLGAILRNVRNGQVYRKSLGSHLGELRLNRALPLFGIARTVEPPATVTVILRVRRRSRNSVFVPTLPPCRSGPVRYKRVNHVGRCRTGLVPSGR